MKPHLGLSLFNVKIRFSFWFFAVIALFALLDHQSLLRFIAIPVVVHELGHLIAMACCGVRVAEIYFTPVSISMKTHNAGRLSYGRELMVAAGGIAANLLAALLLWRFAFASMRTMLMIASHLVVASFNLLPIGNLDGGQIMRTLCDRLLNPELAHKLSGLISFITITPLTALAVYLLLTGTVNFTLTLTCVYLIITIILRE